MTESKYSPDVNMPENVPGTPAYAEKHEPVVMLLLHAGQYVTADVSRLMLYQAEEGRIGMGLPLGDGQYQTFVSFPGKLLIEEKKVVLP